MNEWKVATILSVVVNFVMAGLLIGAIFYVKDMMDDKNKQIATLQSKINDKENGSGILEDVLAQQAAEETPVEEVQDKDKDLLQVEATEPEAEEELAQEMEPEQQETKEETYLTEHFEELFQEYVQLTFTFEGVTLEQQLQRYDEEKVKAQYQAAYYEADALLNKLYGILEKELPKDAFSKLRKEQREWEASLNAETDESFASGSSNTASLQTTVDAYNKTLERDRTLINEYFGEVWY